MINYSHLYQFPNTLTDFLTTARAPDIKLKHFRLQTDWISSKRGVLTTGNTMRRGKVAVDFAHTAVDV